MESKIISLFLLMAAGGCCATLPIPYLAFRLQRIPAQQFFYNPPQRNFVQQQFIPNYEPLRYLQAQSNSQPQSYVQPQFYVQPQSYVQPQQYPYNLYNAPQPLHRDAVSPVFADHYDTVMHYVQRQPVVPFPTYARKPLLLQGPPTKPYLFKDCGENDPELEKINNKVAATAEADPRPVRRMSSEPEDEITPAELPIVGTRISEEENMESTSFGAGITDVRFDNPGEMVLQESAAESTSSEDKVGLANPANPQGGIVEDNTAKFTNPEEKATTANLQNTQAKSTNSEEKVTTANPPDPQAKSTDSVDEATTANPPNPQAKSTNSQDNETTANPANPEGILQDLIAKSTAPLGKISSGESVNPQGGITEQETVKSTAPEKEIATSRSAAPKEAISEAAKPSDYPQRETLIAPVKVRVEIPKATTAKIANPDSERTETIESGLYQQNPTGVVAPPENNESLTASSSAETKSAIESTSTASNKLTL